MGVMSIRVLIVDDHVLFRDGLARLLESERGFVVAGRCATVEAGLAAALEREVDIVLLDFDLGLERAFDFQAKVHERNLEMPVLILTAGLEVDEARRLLQMGARGIVTKQQSLGSLAEAIQKVLRGETWIDPQFAAAREKAPPPVPADGYAPFTERETAVLRGVFEGYANKEIAGMLEISESAVKAALQRLFQKTGVRTRGQLVRAALEKFPDVV